jgi:tetratricopeptide (TPR) repeat protein
MRSVIFALLGTAAMCVVAFFAYTLGPWRSHSQQPEFAMSDAQFSTELERIREAEKIDDPERRCLAYPDPAELHWDANAVAALCRRAGWKMLSWHDIDDALKQHNAAQLDSAFAGYLQQNYGDPQRHGYLTWTYFWMFQSPSQWTHDAAERWVAARPDSGFALAARGIHYTEAAWNARGSEYASETPQANFARAAEYVRLARADLTAALQREPRLIAAYHGLLRTLRLAPDAQLRQQWIDAALVLDAADPWIYADWIDNVAPKWGGSLMQMAEVGTQAARHAAQNPLLATFNAAPLCYTGEERRCSECGPDGAVALDFFRQAGGYGPAMCFLEGAGAAATVAGDSRTAVRYYSQALRFLNQPRWRGYRAAVLRNVGQREWALQDLADALKTNPRDTTLLYSEGLAFTELTRFGDAESAYRAILDIDPDHENAAIALSMLYLSQLAAPDKARPLIDHLLERQPRHAHAWLLKAALSEGDPVGYRLAARNYLQFVQRNDPANRSDIAAIEARLAALKD